MAQTSTIVVDGDVFSEFAVCTVSVFTVSFSTVPELPDVGAVDAESADALVPDVPLFSICFANTSPGIMVENVFLRIRLHFRSSRAQYVV